MSIDNARTFGQYGLQERGYREVITFGMPFKPFDNGHREIKDPVSAKPWDVVYIQQRKRKLEDIGPIVVTLVMPDSFKRDLKITVLSKLPDGSYELADKEGEDMVGYFVVEPIVQFPDPEKRDPNLEISFMIGNITLNAQNLNSYGSREESHAQALFAGWEKSEDKDTRKESMIEIGIKLEDLGDLELTFRSTFLLKNTPKS